MPFLLRDKRKFLEHFFVLLAIIVATYLAGKLRLSGLAEKSIWFDESFSILFAREPLTQTLYLCKNDVMPPFYFVLLHFWLRLFPAGNMETAIFYPRLLSAIFGVLAIPLIYILGKRLFNPAVGVISVLLLTFSPFHLHYSQEIRMYSLFVVLALMEYIVIFDFIHRPSLKNYILLIILSALLIYTHYFGFLLLAGVILLLWGGIKARWAEFKPRLQLLRSPLLLSLLFLTFVMLLYSPWLTTFLHHLQLTRLISPTEGSEAVLNKLLNLMLLAIYGYTPYAPFAPFKQINMMLLILVYAIFVFTLFLGVIKARREQHQSYFIFLMLFAFPVALLLLYLLLEGKFYERYFLPLLPFVFIFSANGLLSLKHRGVITLVLAIICFVFLGADFSYLQHDIRDTTRTAYNWLEQKAASGDTVIHNSPNSLLPFKCYDVTHKFHHLILPGERLSVADMSVIKNEELIRHNLPALFTSSQFWLVYHTWQAGDPLDGFMCYTARWFLSRGWILVEFRHFSFAMKHIYLARLQKL